MKKELTDITLVVDRSGSMQSIRDDAQGGINAFVAEQAKLPGEALITLVQFDTEYEFVNRSVPADQFPEYNLVPRGATALLDAVGRAINETGNRLSQLNDAERPGLVVVVVMTDGHENSSHEFTKSTVKSMIEHQRSKYSWEFIFLGADQDAFAEAGAMGMARGGAAKYSKAKIAKAYAATGGSVARMRKATLAAEPVVNEFTAEERAEME